MDPEVQPETPETLEPTDAEQEADFAAAFDEEPTATPATPEPAAEAPAEPDVPAQPEPEYVQLTKAQYEELKAGSVELRAALKTLEDRSNGSIGNLKQTLAQIQSATPAGQSVQFSAEDFAELKRDFPEMTDSMVAALNRGMSRLKGTGPVVNDEFINAKVQERLTPELERVRKDSALEVMDVIEPDWRQTVTSPAWNDSLSKESPDYQQTVNNSWKLPEVRAAITKFRADTKPAPKAPARPSRFAAAVTPKSAGGHSPSSTEEQEFLAAFNSK